ncbi:uncharacterized protein [Anabrus simplex]|uniref:uncharacterized protein n=1 Tax=Anabrus simplex TaxID=316456 RepID=UPI0035A37881
MSQQLQVLQCYSCQTFQTQIVKKTNKWDCKICGEKQSVKKVFGQGSGKDCRMHVQRLNALRMKNDSDRGERIGSQESGSNLSPYQQQNGNKATNPSKTESKWAKYLSESSDNSESEDSGDENVQWHPLPQASPVAFELPHVKKQKIEFGSQDSVDFNPFSQKETVDKNNPLNFDLNFDDTLMEITSRKTENEDNSEEDGLDSISIVPVSQETQMKETTGSQDSLASFKTLSQFSKDFSESGSVYNEFSSRNSFTASNTNQPVFPRQTSGGSNASQTKSPACSQHLFERKDVTDTGTVLIESSSRNSFTASNTNQPVFTFTRQTSGGSNASQTKSPACSQHLFESKDVTDTGAVLIESSSRNSFTASNTNQPVVKLSKQTSSGSNVTQTKTPTCSQYPFERNSVVSKCLNDSDSDCQKNSKENVRPVTKLSQKDRKITSIAHLKNALSLFENINDYTEDEIDHMFRL